MEEEEGGGVAVWSGGVEWRGQRLSLPLAGFLRCDSAALAHNVGANRIASFFMTQTKVQS